jgi:L-threonylcarbamoyladenylate synthase
MKRLAFATPGEQDASLPATIAHLKAGGLLAYPTETVYGFGCLLDPVALERLAAMKGGRQQKSFLLLIDDAGQAPGLRWTAAARALAQNFWPGALTLLLRCNGQEYPHQVLGPDGTVALRRTSHSGLQKLLRKLDAPITSTSANRPAQPPALDADTVARVLTELGAAATFLVLDGGTLTPSAPSTIVDCSESIPRLVRPGAIPLDALRLCLHDIRI